MILVDSSVWIDYFSGNESAEADFLDRILGNRAVAIAFVEQLGLRNAAYT